MSKILIVDDEPDILESLAVTLSAKGYDVVSATNGIEGIARAEQERPDVILMDVLMPVLGGLEACRRLKQSATTQHIPVLLLTALQAIDDRVRGLDAGADDFIAKPFNDVELRARVAAFLRTKRLHDELEKNFTKLKELETLRDSLIHMLVHDLKAPLTAVQGGISVVLERLESGAAMEEPHRRLLSNAHDAAKRLVRLIQDILDVNRLEAGRFPLTKKKVDVGALARGCVELLRPSAERARLTLTTRVQGCPPLIDADEDLLQRVLVNIVSNSLKFTDAGGSITIDVNPFPDGHALECVITDTGSGIPKDQLEKIFDKYFQGEQGNSGRKGQGLGLAFCRMAVESHGGTIRAESDEGKGSRFIVRLPIL